ncbi:MAG: serine protease [Planctomycetota bacterium]|nr:serine protease [Planctomycetota bacterium]
MKLISTIAAVAAALALSGAPGEALAEGDIRDTARALAAKSSKAIVTVELVVTIKGGGMMGGGGDEEQEIEVVGTVIDPSGLTVVSASEIDPTSMLKALLGGMAEMLGGGDMDSEVKETLIVLEDGTEFEADVVLKDEDLDLAFIRPRDTETKFDWIELEPRTKPLEMLEEIFVLSRLGRLQNRVPALSLGTVKAIVKGPRTFYICDEDASSGSLGCLAFDSKGQPLGLFVMKQMAGGGSESIMGMGLLSRMMGAGSNRSATATILRSIEDILEIAEQAKTAKVPEKEEPEAEDDVDEEGEMEEPESDEEEESEEDDEEEEEE